MGAGLQRARYAAILSRYPGTPAAAVGQRWRDLDTREYGEDHLRELVVLELGESKHGPKARCAIYRNGVDQNRTTQIACARMIPNKYGFSYVGEGPPPQMPGSAAATK